MTNEEEAITRAVNATYAMTTAALDNANDPVWTQLNEAANTEELIHPFCYAARNRRSLYLETHMPTLNPTSTHPGARRSPTHHHEGNTMDMKNLTDPQLVAVLTDVAGKHRGEPGMTNTVEMLEEAALRLTKNRGGNVTNIWAEPSKVVVPKKKKISGRVGEWVGYAIAAGAAVIILSGVVWTIVMIWRAIFGR